MTTSGLQLGVLATVPDGSNGSSRTLGRAGPESSLPLVCRQAFHFLVQNTGVDSVRSQICVSNKQGADLWEWQYSGINSFLRISTSVLEDVIG